MISVSTANAGEEFAFFNLLPRLPPTFSDIKVRVVGGVSLSLSLLR